MKAFIVLLVLIGVAGIAASALWWRGAIYVAMALEMILAGMKVTGGFRRRR